MKRKKVRRVRPAMTWGDIMELMEKIAKAADRDAENSMKLAAMHRQLAKDLRAGFAGKLMAI